MKCIQFVDRLSIKLFKHKIKYDIIVDRKNRTEN